MLDELDSNAGSSDRFTNRYKKKLSLERIISDKVGKDAITQVEWNRDGKGRIDIFVGGRTLPAVSSSRVVRVTHSGYSTGSF